MRRIYCAECGKSKVNGTRQVLKQDRETGEAAEWERVVWGGAKIPTTWQRTVNVTSYGRPGTEKAAMTESFVLPITHHNCDLCNREILPGDRCVAVSYWLEGGQRPRDDWEDEFLTREAG